MKSNLLKECDVDLLGLFRDFHNKLRASCGRPQCVPPLFAETAPPVHQSLSHNLRRRRFPSRRRARGCLSYFFVSCVISIYLSIDLSVHLFASPTAAGFSCYTTAILLAATSQPKPSTCWRKWWPLSPNALACGRPPRASSPPSPTSSPSFSVKLIDCAHFLAHACMLHLLLLAR